MKKGITRLQALAIGQLVLVGTETILGVLAMTSFPNEGGNRIFNTLTVMLFFAFAVPAIMTFMSAGTLALPKQGSSEQALKTAFGTQKGLFILCILLLIPSISLAFNGFVFFAINCVLGIVLWPFVNKERNA